VEDTLQDEKTTFNIGIQAVGTGGHRACGR
jgi:hypothetical protein